MKKILVIAVAAFAALSMSSCGGHKALNNDLDSLSYFMGIDFGRSVENFVNGIEGEVDMDLFVAGLNDYMNDNVEASEEEMMKFLRNYMNVVNPQKLKEGHDKYFEKLEKKDGVQKTESGLYYKVIREGNLEKKAQHDTDKVKVMYEGKLRNGKIFDSSYERGDTVSFGLNQVIKGWTEGMKLVGEGGEIMLYVPYNLGYGTYGNPRGGIGSYQALEFRVELVEVTPTPEEELKRIEEAKAKAEAEKAEKSQKAKK
ncbi:MAG: FKBP-type peptidyl-prolyl cis-trans isomerase [Tidjanibacter sp.]|nr:FKBP-type peptidyl-prolyl cis-trans isomerase [Tidjanibacter sp.]